jgi:HTH-type transcriptional regulator, transcriptional repressor of NAD biosynthesis genes
MDRSREGGVIRWQHGLIVGKFRPPHKGHSFLIQTALEQVERLTLIVSSRASDPIPAELRAAWLRELFPTIDIRVWVATGYDPNDSELWARLTRRWLGEAPDVMFSSEGYGGEYARYLGCDHVCVDHERTVVPISASHIRTQPLAHLDYLEPPVRAYYVARVVLVGAESTGKSTLAQQMAAHYQTAWVPEYGRPYWEGLLGSAATAYGTQDFVHIAETQQQMEDMLARHANRVLICDTDAFTTGLWHELYLGSVSEAVQRVASRHRHTLHILAGDEIVWEDDGTRDRPERRHWFQQRFRDELAATGRPFLEVSGTVDERMAAATAAIDRILMATRHPA